MKRKLTVLVLDDKEHARLQIEHSIAEAGGFDPFIDWVDRLDGLKVLEGRHYDLAFIDFFLDKDKAYGCDVLDRIVADCVVGFSSNVTASELIESTAKEKGFAQTAAIAKIKSDLENPMLEAFFRALPSGEAGQKPLWLFRQSGVIPFFHAPEGWRIVLVSSRRTGEWIVPKGVVERNMSPEDSALKEAGEEAGIEGRVIGPEVGRYRYEKWGGVCTVALYPMEVLKIHDVWEESEQRKRSVLSFEEASAAIANPDIRAIVGKLAAEKGFAARP